VPRQRTIVTDRGADERRLPSGRQQAEVPGMRVGVRHHHGLAADARSPSFVGIALDARVAPRRVRRITAPDRRHDTHAEVVFVVGGRALELSIYASSDEALPAKV
jgi:hypothetical protein